MTKDIDTSILRAFIAVVETGSVTSAARLLNRTQAAVSQQIKRLEQHFDAELFHREHKRINLAPDGERLVGPAQRLLAMNDETWGMMTTPSYQGEVRLGLPSDLVAVYAPDILRRFNAAWPHVRVSIETGNSADLIAFLENGALDLTLTTERQATRSCETLYRDRLSWVCAPDSTAHLLRPLPITIGGANCRFRAPTLEALTRSDIEWRTIIEITNHDAMCAPVTAGLAVTALLVDSIPTHLMTIGTDSGLPELPEFDINLHLPRRGAQDHTNDLAEALAAEIRADFAARYGAPPARPQRESRSPLATPPRHARQTS